MAGKIGANFCYRFPIPLCESITEEGKMASSVRNMENLFDQQDREILFELDYYGSGGSRFKGSESSALSLLNKLRLEGEGGFCDVTLEVEGRQLATHRWDRLFTKLRVELSLS